MKTCLEQQTDIGGGGIVLIHQVASAGVNPNSSLRQAAVKQ